ncbi:methyltransferase domain-containing protein [Helicobacter ibis]|uniref:Methyltransferase domain-containing protein n=1 Tax=Helicobacter ibis TaxID=2962633 RepID=A0ABT4VEY9_9HELI|nr:methyltransferase domain-containing protein [Helicobacter ibis]MDA3969275.1 methyltransferase domain-containing protein [Helicobacter ibis]
MKYIARKFLDSKDSYLDNAFVQIQMQNELIQIAKKHSLCKIDFKNVLEIGCGSGGLSQLIAKYIRYKKFLAIDIAPFGECLSSLNMEFRLLDMNSLESLDNKYDLIVSNAALQWGNQKEILIGINKISSRDSYLLLGIFGKNNLKEIRDICGVGLSYFGVDDYKRMLDGWRILECYSQVKKIHFKNPIEVFRHFKNTGTNSLSNNFRLTKKILNKIEKEAQNTITYEPIYILAKKAILY